MSRIDPLEPPYEPEDEAGILRWIHPEADFEPPTLFRILQRHPDLTRRLQAVGGRLHVGGLLDDRDREVLVLRTCGRVSCAYEWGSHAAFHGPRAGIDHALAEALAIGREPALVLDDRERSLVRFVDELEESGALSQATWDGVGRFLDAEQRIEALVLVGWYRTMCLLCNTLLLVPEPWMRPWPADVPESRRRAGP
jgi:alkylhydroperoxidase family enzyme